jgi:hypothetical protein
MKFATSHRSSQQSSQRTSRCLVLGAAVGLELLVIGLEASVAKLGAGVHKLELDLLQRAAAGLSQQAAAQRDRALLGACRR